MRAKDLDIMFNDYHRNIDVSLGFFTRFGFDSVSIRLIRKISIWRKKDRNHKLTCDY